MIRAIKTVHAPAAAAEPEPEPPPSDDGVIRVAVVYPTLHVGGAERWLVTLHRHLPRSVAKIVGLCCPRNVLGTPTLDGETGIPTVRRYRDLPPHDVELIWGVPASEEYRRFRGPRVLLSHGGGEWTERTIAALRPYATHFAAVSPHAADSFPAELRRRVTVIPAAAEADRATPTAPRAELRRRLGIPEGSLAVGYLGRFSPEKDPLAAARAVSALPGAVAIYAGWGLPENESRYKAEADRLVGRRIRWTPPPDHVGDVYAALDCLLLTSPSEGWAIVLNEAWLAGVPVVASNTGAVAAIPETMAVVVPTGADGPTLAAAVRQATAPEWRPVVEQARRIVWERYSAAAMGRAWAEYLARTCAARKAARAA